MSGKHISNLDHHTLLRSQFEFPYCHPIADIIESILQKETTRIISLDLNENDNLVSSANILYTKES